MTTRDPLDVDVVPFGVAVGLGAQVVLLASLSSGVGLGATGWWAGVSYAVISSVLLGAALYRSGARTLGPANRVTLARAALVGVVTALVADSGGQPGAVSTLVGVSAVALVLDAVEGQVARRAGAVTALGARFDMEVDAFLILVLSVFVARSLGPWVLAIGALRYVFVVAGWALPWLRAALPVSFARKVVAATQGVVLTAVSTGVAPRPVACGAVALALAALVWSFGRDVGWLWRQRRRHSLDLPG